MYMHAFYLFRYVCMYVRMYIGMYVFMYKIMYEFMYVFFIFMYVCVLMYAFINIAKCLIKNSNTLKNFISSL